MGNSALWYLSVQNHTLPMLHVDSALANVPFAQDRRFLACHARNTVWEEQLRCLQSIAHAQPHCNQIRCHNTSWRKYISHLEKTHFNHTLAPHLKTVIQSLVVVSREGCYFPKPRRKKLALPMHVAGEGYIKSAANYMVRKVVSEGL